MMISDNRELYASVRKIAVELQGVGAARLANELLEALAISSLPGEVLGELRVVLRRIRGEEAYLRLESRRLVDDGIDYVDRALAR